MKFKLDEHLADSFSRFLRDQKIKPIRISYTPLKEINPDNNETVFEIKGTFCEPDIAPIEAEINRLQQQQAGVIASHETS